MKKNTLFSLIRLFLTPVLVILLGLILLFNPDSASALISRLLGYAIIAAGIGFGIAALANPRGRTGKAICSVILAVAGGWLVSHPLMLASSIGRFVGILLVIDAIQDILNARKLGARYLLPIIIGVVGMVLILLPMTTFRLVFSLCGLVVLAVGIVMLLDRLKGRPRLQAPDDTDIIDAL